MDDLIALLQKLGDGEHDDLDVAHEALSEIVGLRIERAEMIDRLKAAESENKRLRKALTDVIADLEYEGGDGWMTGQVHANEYKAASAALENTNAK